MELPFFFFFFCFLVTIMLTSITFFFSGRVVYYKTTTTTSEKRKIPGPWRLPIVGNIHHFLVGPTLLAHRRLRVLASRHGPHLMLLRLGQVEYVIVSSREAAEDVFRTYDHNFSDRPHLAALDMQTYGYTNLFFSRYGGYWRQLRKICVTELLSAKRVKSLASLRKDEISNLVREISASGGAPVNLSRRLMSMTNAVVFRAVMGGKCTHEDRFIELMKEGLDLVTEFSVTDLFPSLGFLDVVSGRRTKAKRMHASVARIMDEIVGEHERALASNRDKVEEDILDVLLKTMDAAELDIPITRQNIKAVIGDLFGAGTDTSSITIAWTMAEMMKNPRVMNKAQTEIREALAGKTNLEEADVANLTYLKLVIKETLRLHPPVPLLIRECRESVEVQGYTVSKGKRILVNVWAIGRDPRCWEDPECFKPERFEESPIDFKGTDFMFLPFGGGRRICPGITFAISTIEVALAHLLFYFDWQLPDGMKADELDMTENFSLTVSLKEELHLVAKSHVPLVV